MVPMSLTAESRRFTEEDRIAAVEPLALLRVLLVDDDAACRESMAMALEACGAEVTAVDSVAAALRCLEAKPPMVVISDIEMPGRDGFALVRELRQLDARRRCRTPAIAVTGLCRRDAAAAVRAAGFDDHVPKPVDLDVLLALIRQVVAA